MDEKAKRGMKAEDNSSSLVNGLILLLIMVVLVVVGMIIYLQNLPDVNAIAFEQTSTSVVATNNMASTQIFASATAIVRGATQTQIADATRRVELRATTTAYVAMSQTPMALTEVAGMTQTVNAQIVSVALTSTAEALVPVSTQTAASEPSNGTGNVSGRAIPTLNMNASGTVCNFAIYDGMIEDSGVSTFWRYELYRRDLDFRLARVLYDNPSASQPCPGFWTPVPSQCLRMEIAVNMPRDEWEVLENRVNILYLIFDSLAINNTCDFPNAELHVYYYVGNDVYVWLAEHDAAFEAYYDAVDFEELWALGALGN